MMQLPVMQVVHQRVALANLRAQLGHSKHVVDRATSKQAAAQDTVRQLRHQIVEMQESHAKESAEAKSSKLQLEEKVQYLEQQLAAFHSWHSAEVARVKEAAETQLLRTCESYRRKMGQLAGQLSSSEEVIQKQRNFLANAVAQDPEI